MLLLVTSVVGCFAATRALERILTCPKPPLATPMVRPYPIQAAYSLLRHSNAKVLCAAK